MADNHPDCSRQGESILDLPSVEHCRSPAKVGGGERFCDECGIGGAVFRDKRQIGRKPCDAISADETIRRFRETDLAGTGQRFHARRIIQRGEREMHEPLQRAIAFRKRVRAVCFTQRGQHDKRGRCDQMVVAGLFDRASSSGSAPSAVTWQMPSL